MHKVYLNVLFIVTAVVLCTLPFLFYPKEKVYIYTTDKKMSLNEEGFINELKKLNYNVVINKDVTNSQNLAIWFVSPSKVRDIMDKTKFTHNFVYSDEYYPFHYVGLKKLPIVLTPHQKLYEHYMRSNIKSALITITPSVAKTSAKRFNELWLWIKNNQI